MADIVFESIAPLLSSVGELLCGQWGMWGSVFWRPPNTIKESVIFWFEIVRSKFWYGMVRKVTHLCSSHLRVLVNGHTPSIHSSHLCQPNTKSCVKQQPEMEAQATIIDLRRASARKRKARSRANMTDAKREAEKIRVRGRMARSRAKQKAEAVGGVAAVGATTDGTTTGNTRTGPTVVLGTTVDPPPSPEKEEPMTIAVDALMALHGPNVIPSPLHPSPSLVRQPAMEAEATIIDLRRASARKRKARSRAKKKEAKHAAERIMVAVAGAAADWTTTTSTIALDDDDAPFAPKRRSAMEGKTLRKMGWWT